MTPRVLPSVRPCRNLGLAPHAARNAWRARSGSAALAPIDAPKTDLLSELAEPVRDFLETEAGSAGLLLGATVIALLWANSPWSDRYFDLWATQLTVRLGGHRDFAFDLRHWLNDGLMAFFFFVVGLEVRREFSVGELTNMRRVAIPAIGAVAGLLIPALIYLAVNPSGDAANGWGVVIGTDTAFVLGALTLVGPSSSAQLRVFLLTMTVFDDILAIGMIGIFYSDSIDIPAWQSPADVSSRSLCSTA